MKFESPYVYTDLTPLEDCYSSPFQKPGWFDFINIAYLLIPNNNLSSRMYAERALIKAGWGEKLKVYIYHVGSDFQFSRWEAHRTICLDAMDNCFEKIAVFEHDVRFLNNISIENVRMIQQQVNNLPVDWRMYLLGHDANFCVALNEPTYRIMSKHNFAYIASRKHMDWLARMSPSVYKQHLTAEIISMFSPNRVVPHDLAMALCTNVFGIVPPIAYQEGKEQHIDGATMGMFEHPFLRSGKQFLQWLMIAMFDGCGYNLFP
jgi:hypothetical protein